jgi:D-alanine transaminase
LTPLRLHEPDEFAEDVHAWNHRVKACLYVLTILYRKREEIKQVAVIAYYNGEFVNPDAAQVPIDERGHEFGDGVYEVIRVYGGRLFLADWHLERLIRSLEAIAIKNPHTYNEWLQLFTDAVRRSGEAEATLYVQVTRGIAVRNHLFPDAEPAVSMMVRPVAAKPVPEDASVVCLPDERWANVYVKSLNLLPNVLAKEIAHREGAVEALLVRSGFFTEGSSSNAWFVRGDTLYTAPANRYILNGITRRYVLQLAEELGLSVKEEAVKFAELESVDEVFMTGTTTEILPITRILVDEGRIGELTTLSSEAPTSLIHGGSFTTCWQANREGRVTKRLLEAFRDRVERFKNYQDAYMFGV